MKKDKNCGSSIKIYQFSQQFQFKKHKSNCFADVEECYFSGQLRDQQGHQPQKGKDPGFPTRLLMAIPVW